MGHDIASATKFRASSLFQKFEAEALMAVVDASAAGADDVTDLIYVNMKGPDYASHMHGPDSPELKATLVELDRQMAAYLALMEKKAGPGRSLTVVTADHGTPGGPGPWRRHHTDEIIALVNKRFDPEAPDHPVLRRCREQPAVHRHRAVAVPWFHAEGRRRDARGHRLPRGRLHRGRGQGRAGAATQVKLAASSMLPVPL